jgi:hypothetical protein
MRKQEAMWERQHELAAEKIYAMCSDLGGFFLKVLEFELMAREWSDGNGLWPIWFPS